MKYSQFNSIVAYEDDFILHNSFVDQYMVLKPLIKDLLVAAKNEGISELATVHPTFYKALKEGGFVIDSVEDEVAKVKELSQAVDLNDSFYRLTINPTMNCNFKCWYCYETHVKGSRMSQDIIARTNHFITKTAKTPSIKHFALSWFGGEPLLYFEDIVLPIIKHFDQTCKDAGINSTIGFTTNAYLINEKMVEEFKKYNVDHLQITLDGCEEDHDLIRYVSKSRGSYQEIISNIKLLVRNGIKVRMRINYTLKNIDRCIEILKDIEDITLEARAYLTVDFHRVWQDGGEDSDAKVNRVVLAFRSAGFQVDSHYIPNNVRQSCYADKKNSATLNYNGDIFKCTARDFASKSREGYITENGELIWENDSLNKRLNAKFNNKPCLSCRILPLCNGGCSQHALEHLGGDDYCVHGFDEREKDKVVVSKFEYLLASKQ